MIHSWENLVTEGQTDGQTDESDFIGRSWASKLKNETIANGTNKKLPDICFISTNNFFHYAGKPQFFLDFLRVLFFKMF